MTVEKEEDMTTLEKLLSSYAIALKSYHEAEEAFIDDPAAQNVLVLHRWLDHLVILRDEIIRSARISAACEGAQMEPIIKEAIERLALAEKSRTPAPSVPEEDRPGETAAPLETVTGANFPPTGTASEPV
jgi:hypothetical protein